MLFFFTTAVKSIVFNTNNLIAGAGVAVYLANAELSFHLGTALVGAGSGLFALFVATAVARYWFFRYQLGDDRIAIRQGVFKKTALDVQFSRIQGIDVEESPIFRLLGLATVSFGTAGSTKREGHLPAVGRDFARSLRDRVEAARRTAGEADGDAMAATERSVLLRLDAGDLLRIGLADRSVLVGLAIVPLAAQQLSRAFGEQMEAFFLGLRDSIASQAGEADALNAAIAALVLLFGVVAVLFLLTLASAVVRFKDFALWQEGTALRTGAGLLTRKQVVVEHSKIQQLRLSQGLVMRALKRCRLDLLPAGSGNANPQVQATLQTLAVPLADMAFARALGKRVFREEMPDLCLIPGEDRFVRCSAQYIRARVAVLGIPPAIIGTAGLWPVLGAGALLCLVWPVLVGLMAWQIWRRRAYWHDDDGCARRSGFFGHRVDAFLFRKAQGATVSQSPFQRRRGLADLVVHLASGDVTLPYVKHSTARQLRDYILFKVETSALAWH